MGRDKDELAPWGGQKPVGYHWNVTGGDVSLGRPIENKEVDSISSLDRAAQLLIRTLRLKNVSQIAVEKFNALARNTWLRDWIDVRYTLSSIEHYVLVDDLENRLVVERDVYGNWMTRSHSSEDCLFVEKILPKWNSAISAVNNQLTRSQIEKISIQLAKSWSTIGTNHDDYVRWFSLGREIDEAKEWERTGYTLNHFVQFTENRKNVFSSSEWIRYGFEISEIQLWISKGFVFPYAAAKWARAGHSPISANAYLELGLDPMTSHEKFREEKLLNAFSVKHAPAWWKIRRQIGTQ